MYCIILGIGYKYIFIYINKLKMYKGERKKGRTRKNQMGKARKE